MGKECTIKCNDDFKFKLLKRQLNLFSDENGLWQCGGRLENAVMNYDTKYPYILTKDSYFTKLVVMNSHASVKHNGPTETLCEMRSEFWVTQPRNYIKKLIKDCYVNIWKERVTIIRCNRRYQIFVCQKILLLRTQVSIMQDPYM